VCARNLLLAFQVAVKSVAGLLTARLAHCSDYSRRPATVRFVIGRSGEC
jgi:hypothetical protein